MAFAAFEWTMLGRGVMALRENVRAPGLLANRIDMTGRKAVDVPVPAPMGAADTVTSSKDPLNVTAPDPTEVTVQADQHVYKAFPVTDAERSEIQFGNMMLTQAGEAIRSVINHVNTYVLGALDGAVGGALPSKNTLPFEDDSSVPGSGMREFSRMKVLCDELRMPDDGNRVALLDSEAEGQALTQPTVIRADASGSARTLRRGQIGRIMGFDVYGSNQGVPARTAGGATGRQTSAAASAGATEVSYDTGSGAFKVGDVVGFHATDFASAGTDVYAVVGLATNKIIISPGLRKAVGDNTKIHVGPTPRVPSLFFHRAAAAFASTRVTADGANSRTVADPVSGLALTLEIQRQTFQSVYIWSIKYGCKAIRPEYIARLFKK